MKGRITENMQPMRTPINCSKEDWDSIFNKKKKECYIKTNKEIFGMYFVEDIEHTAEIAHEVNRLYCKLFCGDFSQKHWEYAPQDIKNSAINGVKAIITDPDITQEDIHNKWMEFKKKDGWVYGKEKDSNKKTHPCMIAYEKLPEPQRKKDDLFIAVVKTLLGDK